MLNFDFSKMKRSGLSLSSDLLRLSGKDISQIQQIIDHAMLIGLFIILQPYRVWSTPFMSIPSWMLVTFATLTILPRSNIYNSNRNRSLSDVLKKLSENWLLILGMCLLATYFNKSTSSFSRIATTSWAISGWLWLVLSHILTRHLLRIHRLSGGNTRSIVYWGLPHAAESFSKQLQRNSWMGYRVVAWFCPLYVEPNTVIQGFPLCGGGIEHLREWLRTNKVDKVVFSHIGSNAANDKRMISIYGDITVPVVYAPDWSHPTMRFSTDLIGDQPCIELWGSKQRWLDRQLKRILDIIISSFGIVIFTPIYIIIAVALMIDNPGPILYRQIRYGLDSKCFKCLKFRTMYVMENDKLPVLKQATINDTRITPVGAFLRKWSLDELPQLFNVLIGDMSLVGPRPHAIQHNEMYRKIIPGYMQRHAFKPGITGLAQVSGLRGETHEISDMQNRINADLAYQRDWSLFLDVKILIITCFNLRSGNAY